MIEEKRGIAAVEDPKDARLRRPRRYRARQEAHSGRHVAGFGAHGSPRAAARRGQAERGSR